MKFCMHCGKEIKDTVKFCAFCGGVQKEVEPTSQETPIMDDAPIYEEEVIQEANYESGEENTYQESQQNHYQQQENTQQQYQQQTQNTQQSQQTPLININQEAVNQSVNQFADKGKNYLSYINGNIKNPLLGGMSQNRSFGVISFFVFNLLISLAISHALGKSIHGMNFKFEMLFPVLMLLMIGQFINVLAIYVLSSKIFKNKTNMADIFEHIYAPISIVFYFAAVMFFLTFVSKYGFSFMYTMLLLLTMFFINISYFANIWAIENLGSTRNKFYWTIGIMVGTLIVQLIINVLLSDMIGTSIMELFETATKSITSRIIGF